MRHWNKSLLVGESSLTTEEQDAFFRSKQKLNDGNITGEKTKGNTSSSSLNEAKRVIKSYKDHVMSLISYAYEKVFFNENTKVEIEEINHNKNLQENEAFLTF